MSDAINGKWIRTADQLPPRGKWVLVSLDYTQKPWEIMCYQGERVGKKWTVANGDEEYIFHSWTSGHGDCLSEDPIAWQPLPMPYVDK